MRRYAIRRLGGRVAASFVLTLSLFAPGSVGSAAGAASASPTVSPASCPANGSTVAIAIEDTVSTATAGGGSAPGTSLKGLGGRWRQLPQSPFAAMGAVSAWTGSQMIVVDGAARRSTVYDPDRNEWSSAARPPRGFDRGSAWAWTGQELFVFGTDNGAAFGIAYDPGADGWREIVEPPVGPIHDAVWTGERIVVATRDLLSASYDPSEECWSTLPMITGHSILTSMHAADGMVLAVTEHADGVIPAIVSVLDPTSSAWVASEPSPSVYVGIEDGIWVDGRLVFLLGAPNEGAIVGNVSFDPVAGTWAALDVDCAISTRGAVWTGRLILNGEWRRAYDPQTGSCFRLPPSDDRHRRDGATVWTGRELIHWSGGQGEELRPLRDGVAYRPPGNEDPSG